MAHESTTGMGGEGVADPGLIAKFKEAAQVWARKVVLLFNMEVPPEMEAKKQSLLKGAKVIKAGVEKIFGTFDEFENAGLGILPLIPIAAIAAAGAAITKWSLDYAEFVKKLNEVKRLQAQGIPAEKAAAIVERSSKKSPLFSIQGLAPMLIGAGAIWYFLGR